MRKNATAKALVMSVLALMLCLSMLVGTTFAWFTDSVKSGVNKIVAGNLDVELEYAAEFNEDGSAKTWKSVEGASLFDENALWEPGYTEVVYLRVRNVGTLALQYKLAVNVAGETKGINVNDEEFYLSQYLVFGQVERSTEYANREDAWADVGSAAGLNTYTKEEKLLPNGEQYIALVVYMPTTVGNEANYKTGTNAPTIALGINLYATQVEEESDSFGNDYDADAKDDLPTVEPYTVTAKAETDKDVTLQGEPVSVTVPANAVAPDTTLKLIVEPEMNPHEGTEVEAGAKVASYDIKVVDASTGEAYAGNVTYTVHLEIGKNLENVKVFHDGEAVTGATYNANTGIVTFSTSSFSQFDVTYVETWQSLAAESYTTPVDDTGKIVTIASAEELALFAQEVNSGTSYQGYTVKLVADIDLMGMEWTPIGKNGAFLGTFDGMEKTISNLKVSGGLDNTPKNNNQGLFGITKSSATIKNFTIHNADVSGSLYVGAVVGQDYTGDEISNITVTGDVRISGWWYVGGIAGYGYLNEVKNCTIDANEGSYVKGTGSYIGGIHGFRGEGSMKITNCTSNLDVTGYSYVGGISGMLHYGNTISGCSATGTVTKTAPADTTDLSDLYGIGGIAGISVDDATNIIEDCVYTGTLVSNSEIKNDGVIGYTRNGVPANKLVVRNCTINGQTVNIEPIT